MVKPYAGCTFIGRDALQTRNGAALGVHIELIVTKVRHYILTPGTARTRVPKQ
jgi:hypothetical protein